MQTLSFYCLSFYLIAFVVRKYISSLNRKRIWDLGGLSLKLMVVASHNPSKLTTRKKHGKKIRLNTRYLH